MLEICKKLFNAWNLENVRYCHWKSNEHLNEGLLGLTDLDVFVLPDDKDCAEKGLTSAGYIKFKPQKSARYPLVDEWIGFDYETGRLVHVHLHYQIITGTKYNKEYIFPIEELIISSRIYDDKYNVYIASPNIEIIILYSRIVLKASKKNCITVNKDYKKEIEYLKQYLNLETLQQYCNNLFNEYGTNIYAYIMKPSLETNEWKEVYKIVRRWLKKYKKYSTLCVKIRYKYFYFRNVRNAVFNKRLKKHYISRKTLPQNGLSICFLGADGSGKSTVSIDIQKWLNWKIEADRFYLGSGDHYNSPLKKILSFASSRFSSSSKNTPSVSNVSNQEIKTSSNSVSKEKGSFIRRILKGGYSTLQSVYLRKIAVRSYREIKKAQKYISNGAIAIYDRFPQNQFSGLYDGPKIAKRFSGTKNPIIKSNIRREEKAIVLAQKYQPSIIFKLILPAEESIRRKPDHTLEEVKPKSEITEKLVFENSVVYEIDAMQPYEDEILEIKRLIWKVIQTNDNRI